MRTIACVLLVSGLALADNKPAQKPEAKAGSKKPSPEEMQKMMAEYEKLAAPGPEHKALQESVGSWTTVNRMWMEPGKPPMESQGTEKVEPVLGGRFVQIHASSTMMGKPFEGLGLEGYDNMKKKWVMSWADSFGTMIIYAEGTGDAKQRTFAGEETEPNGQKRPFKWVIKIDGKDKRTMEMWAPGMDGKETKQMEVVYTRAK